MNDAQSIGQLDGEREKKLARHGKIMVDTGSEHVFYCAPR